jgi:hypothetical protein
VPCCRQPKSVLSSKQGIMPYDFSLRELNLLLHVCWLQFLRETIRARCLEAASTWSHFTSFRLPSECNGLYTYNIKASLLRTPNLSSKGKDCKMKCRKQNCFCAVWYKTLQTHKTLFDDYRMLSFGMWHRLIFTYLLPFLWNILTPSLKMEAAYFTETLVSVKQTASNGQPL